MKKINPNTKSVFTPSHERMLNGLVAWALSTGMIAITSSIAGFLALINLLKTNLQTLANLHSIVQQSITGYASQKKAAKKALVVMTNSFMRATYSYAMKNNLSVLASQMSTSRSKLNGMTYQNLVTFAQGVINIISPIATAGTLADYGIAAADVIVWQNLCNKLNTFNTTPRNAIVNREASNTDIQDLLRECMVILSNQCDELIYQFQSSNLTYFNAYWSNRKLDAHSVSTQLRSHCADELGQPIKNAEIKISGTDLVGITDDAGYSLISGIPFGSHSVTIITGTNSKTFGPFDFKKGQSLTQHFTVAPAFASAAKSTATKSKVTAK